MRLPVAGWWLRRGLVSQFWSATAGGGYERYGSNFGCQWPVSAKMAVSGFVWLAGGVLAADGGRWSAGSGRFQPKTAENQQVAMLRRYVTMGNLGGSTRAGWGAEHSMKPRLTVSSC